MKKTLILSILTASLLSACGKSSFDKLSSDELDSNLTPAYWVEQSKDDPDLWKEAVEYCRKNWQYNTKPNCLAVRKAYGQINLSQVINAGSTKLVTEESYKNDPENNIKSLY